MAALQMLDPVFVFGIRSYDHSSIQRSKWCDAVFRSGHAAKKLWQASLVCVLIDDPHSESSGYQLGSDACTASGVRVPPQNKPVIGKASLASVKLAVLVSTWMWELSNDLDCLIAQPQSYIMHFLNTVALKHWKLICMFCIVTVNYCHVSTMSRNALCA